MQKKKKNTFPAYYNICTVCKECPCVDELGYIRVCHCTGEVIESGYAVRRQDNCPLRECPKKKEVKPLDEALVDIEKGEKTEEVIFEALTNYGYNACIDEILGGGE